MRNQNQLRFGPYRFGQSLYEHLAPLLSSIDIEFSFQGCANHVTHPNSLGCTNNHPPSSRICNRTLLHNDTPLFTACAAFDELITTGAMFPFPLACTHGQIRFSVRFFAGFSSVIFGVALHTSYAIAKRACHIRAVLLSIRSVIKGNIASRIRTVLALCYGLHYRHGTKVVRGFLRIRFDDFSTLPEAELLWAVQGRAHYWLVRRSDTLSGEKKEWHRAIQAILVVAFA